jgi:hypothetical protein
MNIKSPHIPTLKVKIIGEVKKALAFIKHSGFQALLTLLGLCASWSTPLRVVIVDSMYHFPCVMQLFHVTACAQLMNLVSWCKDFYTRKLRMWF